MATANAATEQRLCYKCGTAIDRVARVGRRDSCLHCRSDLHCCRNCSFYDVHYHNHCTENQAERQVDKEAGNFCDYFRFRISGAGAEAPTPAADARARLDALFKKK